MAADPALSILDSIKKLLGIDKDYDVFDPELTILINTQFSVLQNVGAAPPGGFMLLDGAETWDMFIGNVKQAEMVKTYIYLKVRLLFDPPSSAFVLTAFESQAKELEWRLNTMEFDFDPSARPIYSARDNRILSLLSDTLDELEDKVEAVDEEVDKVPDLSTIFHENQDD